MKAKKEPTEKKIKINESAIVEEEAGETTVVRPDEIAILQENMAEKEKEAKENYERYLRVSAELDNYRKRAAREKADVIKYGKEDVIKDMLPFLDSLDRALEHNETGDVQSFRQGIALIQEQMLSCLKKHGVERVECAGADFDPNLHEALMQTDSPEHQDNKIVSEVQKGYLLNGRLIRASRVCVCKKNKQNNECEISENNGE